MNKPFAIRFGWEEFDNTSRLTSFQKYRIKTRCKNSVKETIQEAINQSCEDRQTRRQELEAHKDPEDPFKLDLGGEG